MARKIKEELSYLVVKDNDLIQKAKYNLTAQEQKLVIYAISKVKPEDKEMEWLEINAAEFCEITGSSEINIYRDFKKMANSLKLEKVTWIDTPDEFFPFTWFSEAIYMKNQGKIRVKLDSHLKEYVLGLRKNFTQYELWNVLALKGKYSLRLFEVFKSYLYQKEIEIKVDDLRELLMIGADTYPTFKDFERRVVKKAVDEITKNTELNVSYDKVKKGRSVDKLIFHISLKDVLGRHDTFNEWIESVERKSNQIEGQMTIDEFLDD